MGRLSQTRAHCHSLSLSMYIYIEREREMPTLLFSWYPSLVLPRFFYLLCCVYVAIILFCCFSRLLLLVFSAVDTLFSAPGPLPAESLLWTCQNQGATIAIFCCWCFWVSLSYFPPWGLSGTTFSLQFLCIDSFGGGFCEILAAI